VLKNCATRPSLEGAPLEIVASVTRRSKLAPSSGNVIFLRDVLQHIDNPPVYFEIEGCAWSRVLASLRMAKITVINNGPIRVEGDDIEIYDAQGNRYGLAGRKRISLCRCGKSANKPFCDGQHGVTGFESLCQAVEMPPPAAPKPTTIG